MQDTLKFIVAFMNTIMIFLSMFIPSNSGDVYEAKKPEEAKLVFNVFSDVHVETNSPDTYSNFKSVLEDSVLNESCDATFFLGDNTMNCQVAENFLFFGAIKAKLDKSSTYIAVGNHDIGNGDGDFNEMWNRFKTFNNMTVDNYLDKPYFYKVINGYYLISIAPETSAVHTFKMSDEQLDWLKDTLNKASEENKPIFLFSHHPLDWIEDENKNLLFDILNDYSNVYSLLGHLHWDFEHYNKQGVDCFNIPSVTKDGIGVVVEVYDNEVIFRERNFINAQWGQEISFPIAK